MKISDSIELVLAKGKVKKIELGTHWNTTRQAVSNKFYRDYWSANELADIARLTGSKLMFVFPDGQQIYVDTDEPARFSTRGALKEPAKK